MSAHVRITTETGSREVPCFWRNGALAVTPDVGSVGPEGTEREANPDAWTITHVPTGRGLGTLHGNPEVMRALAEHLAPVIPWAEVTLEQLLADHNIRKRVTAAARAFWDATPVESR